MRQTGQVLPVELRTKEKDWDLADIPLLILEEFNIQFPQFWNYFLYQLNQDATKMHNRQNCQQQL